MLFNKHFFAIVVLSILASSALYISFVPAASASGMTSSQKATDILNTVVGLRMDSYATSIIPDVSAKVPTETVVYNITEPSRMLRAACTFVNGSLNQIYLSDYLDSTSNQPTTDSIDLAKGFLGRYAVYTENSFYNSLSSMLDNVAFNTNVTKTAGNIKFESSIFGNQTEKDLIWTYIDNSGTPALSKNVVLSYRNGHLESFLDNWQLYTIAGSPSISSQEVIAAAMQASSSFKYTVQNAKGENITISGFNVKAVFGVSLSYLNYFENTPQYSIRSGNPYLLYPSWYVGLGFDKVYPANVTGLNVRIWADSGSVSSVEPIIVDMVPEPSALTPITDMSLPILRPQSASMMSAVSITLATIVVTANALIGVYFCSKRANLGIKRAFTIKGSKRKALAFLIVALPAMLILMAPSASATSKVEIYISAAGYPDYTPYGFSYWEVQYSYSLGSYIQNDYYTRTTGVDTSEINFAANNGNSAYNTINYNTMYDEGTYPTSSVFAFGNGYMPTFVLSNNGNNITHTQISQATNGYQTIAFAWQFMCTGAGISAFGQPNFSFASAWTQTDLSDAPDGFNYPDSSGHAFIGFKGQAPMIHQQSFRYYTQTAYDFVKYFYDAATSGNTIHDSLNIASERLFGVPYNSSPLTQGYQAYWPGGFGIPEQYFWGRMAVFGDSNIYISPGTIETVSTPSISGAGSGNPYEIGVSSSDSYGSNVAYLIDWGDGSQSTFYNNNGYYYSSGDTEYFDHTYGYGGQFTITVYAASTNNVWSQPSYYTANIASQSGWLTVSAQDGWGFPVSANLYVDSNWIGIGSASIYLSPGWHTIDADNPAWDDYFGTVWIQSGTGSIYVDGNTYATIYYG